MSDQPSSSPTDKFIEAIVKQQTLFAETAMKEIRANRRGANFRAVLYIGGFAALVLFNVFGGSGNRLVRAIPSGEGYISIIRLTGVIEDGARASLEKMEAGIYEAFHDEDSQGVLLIINSPGGTPVQSKALNAYLQQMKRETNKKLVVLGADYLTSGAYMVAVAADKIYVDESTMTGSIGVYQQRFGLKTLANNLGIEAINLHAGEHKRRLDPFGDIKPEDIAKTQKILTEIHQDFIHTVEAGRGSALSHNPELFSGDYWTGTQAVELGLVDGVGVQHAVMQAEFGVEHALDYSLPRGWLDGLGAQFSTLAQEAVSASLSTFGGLGPRL